MSKSNKKQTKSKVAKPAARKKQAATPTFEARSMRARPALGLVFVVLTMLLGISLLDYDPSQSALLTTDAGTSAETSNLVGTVGATISGFGLRWLGLAIFSLPFYTFWLAYMAFFKHFRKMRLLKWVILLLAVISLACMGAMSSTLFQNIDPQYFTHGLGGVVGGTLFQEVLKDTVGPIGSSIILITLFILANSFLLYDNIASTNNMRGLLEAWKEARASARENALRRAEEKAEREARRAEREAAEKAQTQTDAARKNAQQKQAEKAFTDAPPTPKQATEQANNSTSASPDIIASSKEPSTAKSNDNTVTSNTQANTPDGVNSDLVEPPDEVDVDFTQLTAGGEPIEPNRASSTKLRKISADKGKRIPPPIEPAKRKPPPPSQKGTLEVGDTLNMPAVHNQAATPISPAASPGGLKIVASESTRKATQPHIPERKGKYIFPSMRLLQEPSDTANTPSAEDHEATATALVQTLSEFGVKVEMGEVHAGPVITRYDVYPAPGVRVEKIANLDKNIALSLKAMSVRILAPVPGKGCVGIEVPNKKPLSVCIRDILESEDWSNYNAEIPIALGKEVSGRPLMADLTKMPHLLIAGSTGSGKTVCINAVIASLLFHSSPEDLRFVMVDPKIVEMQVYNDLPHMLIPVVTDPKKVPGALKYLLKEMESRYQLFATKGVRNIAGYNAKMAKIRDEEAEHIAAEMDANLSPEERAALSSIEVPRNLDLDEQEAPEKLPYIICIVDELADLMMVAPADIETGIARLAQLARAAGIHLILATQRPSVNVITGVIKANLPSRISFKVASKVDSRTILDGQGAEGLIGRGDMLFLPPGSANLIRSQGAFVSDEEINDIVAFIKENNDPPEFDEQFQRTVEEGDADEGEDDGPFGDDDQDSALMKKALEVIKTSKRASTSHLQRRLSIGYNRAARVMDKLEDAGIIGPDNGSSPREILVDLEDL